MIEPLSPKAPGYSAAAPAASIFALAEPDFEPLESPTRTGWALTDDGQMIEIDATQRRSKA